jgi:hypothetical protein
VTNVADSVQFDDFVLSYESYLMGRFETVPRGLDADGYYAYMIDKLRRDPRVWAVTGFGFVLERGWYAQNRPEFKLYPGILEALQDTKVAIDARYFKMPFSTFMVRFPKRTLREHENAPYVRALIATTVREPVASKLIMVEGYPMAITEPGAPEVEKLVIYVSFDWEDVFNFFKFPLLAGQTIQRTFDDTKMRGDGKEIADTPLPGVAMSDGRGEIDMEARHGYWPSRAFYTRLLQIVVGTAFFGIGRDRQRKHQLVEQDRLPRSERRQLARATGQPTRHVTRPVFVVGRDIQLPRFEPGLTREPTETDSDAPCASCNCAFKLHTRTRKGCAGKDAEGNECQCLEWNSGRHISYGYIRCGHLHYYCTGSRKNGSPGTDYELRWIDPTAVRPDLPFGPSKARAIKSPTGEIISADLTRLQNP